RREPTGPQVEERGLVDLANGRAVSALHIVGVNRQLRLGIYRGVLGEKQVLVGLTRVRLLGIGPHQNPPAEHRRRPVADYPFVDLPAGAARLEMINEGGVVQMLAPRRQIQSVEGAFRSLGIEGNADLISNQSTAQGDGVRGKSAVLPLLDLGERDV